MKRTLFFALVLFYVMPTAWSQCEVLRKDAIWSGEVIITEDILVPAGITLTITPGTVIRIFPSESTKVDPEYLSALTEIVVRGTVRAQGTKEAPIQFSLAGKGSWAGMLIDGGTALLESCSITDADTGIYITAGFLDLKGTMLRNNRYGLVAQGQANVIAMGGEVTQNDYGIFSIGEAKVELSGVKVKNNKKFDSASSETQKHRTPAAYIARERALSREYGDAALLGDTVWRGLIRVTGTVRVPEGSRLVIVPGTIIEFSRKDTDADGTGENGLMVQGVIIAKGTKEAPIIFRSAEKQKRMGDWDSINIMNSDGAWNLIENCQVEDAYRGIHFHFSNVVIRDSVFTNNYRGIQFQESYAEIIRNRLFHNKSGLQARDSEVVLSENEIACNYYGAVFFRVRLTARGNIVQHNMREGMRLREGVPVVEENSFAGNRFGLLISDLVYGSVSRNAFSRNLESGITMKSVDNIEITGNYIGDNRFNGIHMQDSSAMIGGNLISGNGERGIGILSFNGVISGNNFVDNRLYAIDLEGSGDVTAPLNWWGTRDVSSAVYDNQDEKSRGRILHENDSETPLPFTWPLRTITTDTTWQGDIRVHDTITVLPGSTLSVLPDTKVIFSRNAGLRIEGKLLALGEKGRRIAFSSEKKSGPSEWDEVLLDHAEGSVISHCDFENATWAVHSHFTDLIVTRSSFRNNYGGIRFRSGPVEVNRSLFERNEIGVRSYRGSAFFHDNIITRNEIGIFVREKGSGLRLTNNNIFQNSGYNVRLGDFNDEDVQARSNWWGAGNPSEKIFDDKKEPGVGMVIFEPFAEAPFEIGVE